MGKDKKYNKKNSKKLPPKHKLNGKGKIPEALLRKSENSTIDMLDQNSFAPQFNLIAAQNFQDVLNSNQRRFLEAFAKCGIVTLAATIAKIHMRTHYEWMRRHESYKQKFREAQAIHTDRLEYKLFEKATNGDDNTCLIFALKGALPHKYSEKHQVSGPGGGPVQVDHDHQHRHELGYKSRAELLTLLASEINKARAAEIEEQRTIETKAIEHKPKEGRAR